MKKVLLAAVSFIALAGVASAQTPGQIKTVVKAEEDFNKTVQRKGIKEGYLSVADPEGIVFKPNEIKITDFYGAIDKLPGTLTWTPKFGRISAAGDLAFTAGPYVYQNGKTDDDKVYGEYVSIWRLDDKDLKLIIDLGIQHPEPEQEEVPDLKDPDPNKKVEASKDPFAGKNIIMGTDKVFNQELEASTQASYKEFLSPDGRLYFPGFEPLVGQDKIINFLNSEAISISAETVNVGRALSNDLAYSYGRARIKKGDIVARYNYVRIWEVDANHKWNVLLEVLSAVENE